MRVLQIVKSTEGARWAAWQSRALTRMGVQVHVVLPSMRGEAIRLWRESGARIHVADLSLPLRRPWLWKSLRQNLHRILDDAEPDLIHSHFVTNTIALRLALGRGHRLPIIFQVPGPLHLESPLTRWLDLGTAGGQDYWIASSRYTRNLYKRFHAPRARVFLSYYGFPLHRVESARTGKLRDMLEIKPGAFVVGNINNIYPPKYLGGQTTGSKGHEHVIDALACVCRARPDVTGVLVGGQWGGGSAYRARLLRRAREQAGGRIRFVERVGFESVNRLWADYDCAVHLPISENCGGVVEPLAAGVPTVASHTGGLPEVIIDGVTGWLVPPRSPEAAAERILHVLDNHDQARRQARVGRALVMEMFDIDRTAGEVAQIYGHVLGVRNEALPDFDSMRAVRRTGDCRAEGRAAYEVEP
jgi:glycosyltransferase involved in cell wall biosynthesis